MKYIDYEFTPEVLHILPPGSDGKEKSETAPAKLCFIAVDGSRHFVMPGSPEARALFEEVKKNNPVAHAVIEEKKADIEEKNDSTAGTATSGSTA